MVSKVESFEDRTLRRKKVDITHFIIKYDIFFKIKILLFFISLYIVFMGIFGTQIGILNPAITIIWIGWWVVISVIFLPINAKNWCAICPIPLGSQLFYRYAPTRWFLSNKFSKNSRFYVFLPILLFLIFSAISVPLSTIPLLTGVILALLITSSTLIDIYYDERTFCTNVCPINPLLLTYNRNKRISLKTLDFSICVTEHEKTCMIGDEASYGCDWGYFPGKLKANVNNCTNCLECIKSCNYNNLIISNTDNHILPTKEKTIKFIDFFYPLFFLGIIITYIVTKIGSIEPFHNTILIDSLPDLIFSLAFESIFTIILIPGLFTLFIILPLYYTISSNRTAPVSTSASVRFSSVVKKSSLVSIPLSLSLWIVFSIFLILPNINLLFNLLADPFLLNWNILNLKGLYLYSGQYKELTSVISQIVMIIGYYFTLYYAYVFTTSQEFKLKEQYIIMLGQFLFYSLIFGFSSLIFFG